MMKAIHICLLVIAGLLIGAIAADRSFAQPELKTTGPTAVCDIMQVFNECNRGRELSAQNIKELEAIKVEVDKRDAEIKGLVALLQREDLVKTGPQYEQTLDKHTMALLQREAYLKVTKQKLLRKRHKLTVEMYRQILQKIQTVAQRRGIHIVLFRERKGFASRDMQDLYQKIASRKVLYWDDKLDMTTVVLAGVNAAYSAEGK